MARPLRLEFAGALYHITTRCNRKHTIYQDANDRLTFLSLLATICMDHHWLCHAYCLMNDHYHLLIETPQGNLSKGMRQLNGIYTQRFNHAHKRTGHLFQGRYQAILIQKDGYMPDVSRHIVLNPVRANLVASVHDWQWSSYRATAGLIQCPDFLTIDWLLSVFSPHQESAFKEYQAFVASGRHSPSPWKHLRNQIFLGGESFVSTMQTMIDRSDDLSEIPLLQRRTRPLPLTHYEKTAHSRNEAIANAYASGGYTLKEIGGHFGLHYSTISGIIRNHKMVHQQCSPSLSKNQDVEPRAP